MVMTRGCGGEGLSLEFTSSHETEPRTRPVVMVETDQVFSAAAMDQARGRCRRPLAQRDVEEWKIALTHSPSRTDGAHERKIHPTHCASCRSRWSSEPGGEAGTHPRRMGRAMRSKAHALTGHMSGR